MLSDCFVSCVSGPVGDSSLRLAGVSLSVVGTSVSGEGGRLPFGGGLSVLPLVKKLSPWNTEMEKLTLSADHGGLETMGDVTYISDYYIHLLLNPKWYGK